MKQNLYKPFSDLGWGLAGVFIVITLILVQVIGKPHPEQDNSRAQGALIAELYWDDKIDVDMDLWLLSPVDSVPVGYSRKSSKGWSLLVDDLGTNKYTDLSGKNREFASTRSMEPGHYIINAHYYRGKVSPVKIKLIVTRNMNGGSQQIFVVNYSFVRVCEERTLIQFDIDGDGNLIPDSVFFTLHKLRSNNECLPNGSYTRRSNGNGP